MATQQTGYGYQPTKAQATYNKPAPAKQYGTDPKGTVMNTINQQTQRFNDQQGPLANAMAYNYGRGSEADYGNYTDIMNNYRDIASGGGAGGAGGGGGGGGYSAFTVSPGRAGYSDPFKSYAGFEEFSQTGGYSPADIANMRARGVSPVRAAYANAEREVGRQRSLQGGYSPNAIAAQVKMAREQGQSSADAIQNVEAGLAQQRQQGRLAGLGGMSNIEGQRLNADVDISKFNTGLDFQGQTYNADAMSRAQSANNASSAAGAAADMDNRFRALSGMSNLYGTTPGMSQTFGNQALTAVNMGGVQGLGVMSNTNAAQQNPGAWQQGMGRVNDVMDLYNAGSTATNAFLTDRKKKQTNVGGGGSSVGRVGNPQVNNDASDPWD